MNPTRWGVVIADAVAARDAERLGSHFTDDVRLRALLPGGLVEANGRPEVLKHFDDWFGGYTSVELVEARGELVGGDRLLVHYRLAVATDEGPTVVTQTLIGTPDRDAPERLARIDLLCSGFRPGPP